MALNDILGNFGMGNLTGGMTGLVVMMLGGLLAFGLVGWFMFILYNRKKRWFLNAEIKIPRSDGKFINSEWGKGSYDAKKGVVYIKRKGKKPVAIKPFDIKKYIQGTNTITVIQVGIEDYRPVLIESWLEMVDDETGEKAAMLNAVIDTSETKAWKTAFEREAKSAYSIQNFLQQYAQYIGFGILFFMIFVGFSILYSKVT